MRRKVLLVAILISAMLLQCIMPFMPAYAVTSVEITLNSNLYKAIKAQLEEQNIIATYIDANNIIIIPQTELEKVTTLNLSNSGIDDLAGLDAFSKVTDLNLQANYLTVDSNLEVLNNLNLNRLDLSVNQLSSVKAIENFNSIPTTFINQQTITETKIISVDEDTKEVTVDDEDPVSSRIVSVELPDILLEDGNQVNSEWYLNEPRPGVYELTREVEPIDASKCPDVDINESFAPGSTELKLNVANVDWNALKGLIKFKINVPDSSSKLKNTNMEFNYIIIDSEEEGIIFNDKNLYKAVKDQLSKNQNINEELKETTNLRKLYKKDYDSLLVLIIDKNDIFNRIPSLKLSGNEITDLTGIEKFVGLSTELDIDYNYITSIDKIVELANNKIIKETELKERYSNELAILKTEVTKYNAEIQKSKDAQKVVDEIDAMPTGAEKDARAEERATKSEEVTIAKANAEVYFTNIKSYQKKLYSIYENEYKILSLLPVEVNYLSKLDLMNEDISVVTNYATTIMDRVSALEKVDGLTSFEVYTIRRMIKEWGNQINPNKQEFKTTEMVYTEANPTGYEEKIEYPISVFFEKVKSNAIQLNPEDWRSFVYRFKCLDAMSQVENYSKIKRNFEAFVPTYDYAEEAKKEIIKLYEERGYDTSFIDDVNYNDSVLGSFFTRLDSDGNEVAGTDGEGYELEMRYDTSSTECVHGSASEGICNGYSCVFHMAIKRNEYLGVMSADEINAYRNVIAQRLYNSTDEEIDAYVTLPRLQKAYMSNNEITSLEGIDTLKELKELNVWKNLVNDISNVNWEIFTKIEKLNLGYNQISDIKPLERLYTLKDLNVSYNLLSGKFTFNLSNMFDLNNADFSHNQYNDISYINNQYYSKIVGRNISVPEYLEARGIKLNFKYQTTEITTNLVNKGNEFIELELPAIFSQVKSFDKTKVTYGIDSLGGNVLENGTKVKIRMPANDGSYSTIVRINGRDNYVGEEYKGDLVINGGLIELEYVAENDPCGMAYGTICTINYVVESDTVVTDPIEPENPGETPEEPGETPENPDDVTIEVGYKVVGECVMVYEPQTEIEDFKARLVDLNLYDVELHQNGSEKYVTTGAVATIKSKTNPELIADCEVIVKGDLTLDGEVNSFDSGIVRDIIFDNIAENNVYKLSGDVNEDGKVDSSDLMLILMYRASRISSFDLNN